jgi:hypothetical protein
MQHIDELGVFFFQFLVDFNVQFVIDIYYKVWTLYLKFTFRYGELFNETEGQYILRIFAP